MRIIRKIKDFIKDKEGREILFIITFFFVAGCILDILYRNKPEFWYWFEDFVTTCFGLAIVFIILRQIFHLSS